MQDTKLFETILGIRARWRIARVALDTSGERVDLWAEHADDTSWRCPDCNRELACRDHADERVWRHFDTWQYQTFLHARVPRVDTVRQQAHRTFPRHRRTAAHQDEVALAVCMTRRICPTITPTRSPTCWPANSRSVAPGRPKRRSARCGPFRQGAAVCRFFAHWYARAIRSPLEPVKKVARTLKRHLAGVLRT